jgi:pimeloyl-ACP methyl ester carboxylesterase
MVALRKYEIFIKTNGLRLFGVRAGEGPLVLLLHGFPEFWWSWSYQLDRLAEAGFSALAVDLVGYGRSDKPDRPYDIRFLCETIAGIPPALGYEKMAVCGHDWGGIIVWTFARMFPEKLWAVVGVNTPDLPRPPAPPIEILRRRNPNNPNYIVQFQTRGAAEFFIELDVEKFFRLMFLGPATRQRSAFTAEVIRRYVDQFRPKGAFVAPLDYYRCLDRNWELTKGLAEKPVEVPALMVVAENDPVLTPQLSEGMEQRIPNLKKVLIGDCGHWTQLEQPEELTRHLVEFLEQRRP